MRDVVERFEGDRLDPELWVDHYLPHWTTPERSAARYELSPDGLRLRVDADQPAWRPEDGRMRVSNLQTGSWAGPVGGTRGQHRHRPDGLTVRTAVPPRRLWTPTFGRLAVTASASPDPVCMLGIWLVGFEESSPGDSGEICLAELFGDRLGPAASTVRLGIKAHHDPRLTTDVRDLVVPLDARRPHTYAAAWDATGVRLSVDGDVVFSSGQVLAYPVQLMLDLFEFPADDERPADAYPKSAVVHEVRGSGPLTLAGSGRPSGT